jgi:hypothetical protein
VFWFRVPRLTWVPLPQIQHQRRLLAEAESAVELRRGERQQRLTALRHEREVIEKRIGME